LSIVFHPSILRSFICPEPFPPSAAGPHFEAALELFVQPLDRVRNRNEDGGAFCTCCDTVDCGVWCDHPGQRRREHEGAGVVSPAAPVLTNEKETQMRRVTMTIELLREIECCYRVTVRKNRATQTRARSFF
jgi:hypothetical protein